MLQTLRSAASIASSLHQVALKPDRDAVLQALYGAIGQDAQWNEALHVFANYFEANISLLVVSGQGQRDKSFYAAYNHREDAARAYSDYWWQHDIVLQTAIARGEFRTGLVGRGSDLVPNETLRNSKYYKEFLVTMPAEHLMACILSDGSDSALAPPMYLSFFRPPGAEDFSDADVAELAGLYPHVHRAFELHWAQRSTAEQLRIFHQSLDGLDFGVVFIDPAGSLRHANAAANQMMSQPWLGALMGGLGKRVPSSSGLAQLTQSCAAGEGGALSVGSGSQRLFALALPLDTPVTTPAGETRTSSVMLVLIDPGKQPRAALDFVVQTFGLSKAEARLLPLLFDNRSTAEMAVALDIKISTLRSQLSAIFAKTGTTRQQELIRLLGALPAIQRFGRGIRE